MLWGIMSQQQGSSRNLEDLQVWSPTNAHLVTKQFEDLLENESDLSAQLKAMKGLCEHPSEGAGACATMF